VDLRTRLLDELARRRARNPRYSLRAFARHLGTDHTTISRVSSGRRLTVARMRALGPRLGLGTAEIERACQHENMLRVRDLLRRPGFRPDSRWIATRTGIALDDVNVALQALLAARRLHMTSTTTWTEELR
jgi:hypothetical protein